LFWYRLFSFWGDHRASPAAANPEREAMGFPPRSRAAAVVAAAADGRSSRGFAAQDIHAATAMVAGCTSGGRRPPSAGTPLTLLAPPRPSTRHAGHPVVKGHGGGGAGVCSGGGVAAGATRTSTTRDQFGFRGCDVSSSMAGAVACRQRTVPSAGPVAGSRATEHGSQIGLPAGAGARGVASTAVAAAMRCAKSSARVLSRPHDAVLASARSQVMLSKLAGGASAVATAAAAAAKAAKRSSSSCALPPQQLVSIDRATDVPADLYNSLLEAGRRARARGQHAKVRDDALGSGVVKTLMRSD